MGCTSRAAVDLRSGQGFARLSGAVGARCFGCSSSRRGCPRNGSGWPPVAQAQTLEEGNPLDRTVFLILILLSIVILFLRSFKWGDFVARNLALVAFIAFCLLSVFWSDEPFISFKRWYRDLGNYLVILVVLSDPCPLEAVRTVLRRLCYVLIPLSIVLIKYFSNWGRQYEIWSGSRPIRGSGNQQEHAGCALPGQRNLFFLGHGHALVPTKGAAAPNGSSL